jgi:KaiC/GvpD/RAD55 family RecA-like ATPase
VEKQILATLLESRAAYDIAEPILDQLELSPYSTLIAKSIAEYYAADETAESVDQDILEHNLQVEHPNQWEVLSQIMAELPSDVSTGNVVRILRDYREKQACQEIAHLIHIEEIDTAKERMGDFLDQALGDTEESVFNDVSIEELQEQYRPENLITIYPSILNEVLGGGVPRQAQIGIVARPDVGKTVGCMNIAVPCARDGHKVLYFGNEDPDLVMITRALTRFTRVPKEELFERSDYYMQEARERGYGNFTFISLHPGTVPEIKSYVRRYQPDLIVVDQLRNLSLGKRTDGYTELLNRAAAETRNIAKQYNCVSVIVTQAGESAHNKIVLDYTDVEYSNTGFAAALDLMIGMGQNSEMKMKGQVSLSFPKNKLTAPLDPMRLKIDYATNTLLSA